jgi:hypothetical protein
MPNPFVKKQALHYTLCETYPVVFIGLVLEKYVRVANTIVIFPIVDKYTCSKGMKYLYTSTKCKMLGSMA